MREEEQKRAQIEELKRLKNLRRKLVEEQLAKSFKAGGVDTVALAPEDIDADFDPDTWDRKMAQLYNDDYYAQPDDDLDRKDLRAENERADPWESMNEEEAGDGEEEYGNYPPVKPKRGQETDIGAAAQYDLDDDEADDAEVPGAFKFRYRQVQPNDYGLTDEEILLADPSTLNSFVSLRRLAPYREAEWCVLFISSRSIITIPAHFYNNKNINFEQNEQATCTCASQGVQAGIGTQIG